MHRDVKPANVLIAGDDHAYLGDFGLTRLLSSEEQLTETGQWLGTTDFSSPEQLQGERIDARADIYSLGCVLHAALFGKPPYPRATVPATLLAHLQDPIPRPSESGAPTGFDRVMARALAKDPEDRYPSAGDLGRAALAAARGRAGDRVRAQRRDRPGGAGRARQRAPEPADRDHARRHAAHAGPGGGDHGHAAAPPAPRGWPVRCSRSPRWAGRSRCSGSPAAARATAARGRR